MQIFLNHWGDIFSVLGLVGTIVAIFIAIKISGETNQIITGVNNISQRTEAAGIRNVYENRDEALSSFLQKHKDDKKMIIVGSSLKGFWDFLKRNGECRINWNDRLKNKYLETKFLLTHPCFARFREMQEDLDAGKIQKEIDDSLDNLKHYGIDMENCVRFYRGAPTCFMIITSDAMLLNPYAYQIPSYRSFCLEVKRLEDTPCFNSIEDFKKTLKAEKLMTDEFLEKENDLLWKNSDGYNYFRDIRPHVYGQFYWYHYLLPWFSKQAVTYNDYNRYCKSCTHLTQGFLLECPLDKGRGKPEMKLATVINKN